MRSEASGDGVAPRLYRVVKSNPGIHFRGLKRAADVTSNGQLRYHLDRLKDDDALVEVEDGGYTRFFVPGEYPRDVRQGIARFARRVPRTIGRLLLNGPMTRTELREALGCADSTLGYHLNRMLRQDDLERDRRPNRSLYALKDPDLVQRILRAIGDAEERPDLQADTVQIPGGSSRDVGGDACQPA